MSTTRHYNPDIELPTLTRVRQRFPDARVADIEGELSAQLAAADVRLAPRTQVAIAVGSRGIANLARIVRGVIGWVTAQGAVPFLVPAMGSHGGATADGQRAVLEGYGLTEDAVGAPIRSDMAVIELPQGEAEVPVYCDRHAHGADATIIINRVKPHTSFHGTYESGLMKMLAIGLGKQQQALAIHNLGVRGLREVMPQVARQVLYYGNVVLGVAIVENAYDDTLALRAIPAADIPAREPELLEIARASMPGLPVEALDLLIVDEVGKNISGLGMDPNVIGRLKIPGQPEPERPAIHVIYARTLTGDSHGNACGIGLADIISRRLYERIDLAATYANVLTTGFLERGKIPIIAEDDRQALSIASRALGGKSMADARIMRIHNTLQLEQVLVSPALLRELQRREDIEVLETVEANGDNNWAEW